MHTQSTVHFGAVAGRAAVFQDNNCGRPNRDRAAGPARPCGCWSRTEHRGGGIGAVAGVRQVFLDQPLRHRMHGNEPDFGALAPDPEMQHALPALQIETNSIFELCGGLTVRADHKAYTITRICLVGRQELSLDSGSRVHWRAREHFGL